MPNYRNWKNQRILKIVTIVCTERKTFHISCGQIRLFVAVKKIHFLMFLDRVIQVEAWIDRSIILSHVKQCKGEAVIFKDKTVIAFLVR